MRDWGVGRGGTHSGECAYGAGLEEGAGFEVEGEDLRGDGERILANAPTGLQEGLACELEGGFDFF